jgi:hypothetical protein
MARKLTRTQPFRTINKRILIVCEGEKTEFNYFKELRQTFRIPGVTIKSSPHPELPNILKCAQQEFKKSKRDHAPFNKVFCVFDRDNRPQFEEICRKINEAKPTNVFFPITSDPCFEYWILLHFIETTRSFVSPQEVQATLFKECPNYRKNDPHIFNKLKPFLETALDRASKGNQFQGAQTNVHKLVCFLLSLASDQ